MKDMVASLLTPGLDADGDTPLNEQLAQLLRHAVLKGQLSAGERLPASRALATRLSLSRNTVLAAYDQLIAEGYLETRQGAGTFITADLPDQYLQLAPSADTPVRDQRFTPNRPLAGMPALDAFPTALWARIGGSVWRHATKEHLQHMDPAGYRPLRSAIATYLHAARGVVADPDQIIIISGVQPGLRLLAESVVPADRALVLEDPGYPGLSAAVSTLPHPKRHTGVDADGAMVPEGAAGLLVVSPSRQYPLGQTMPLKRRLELLDWAARTGALILEDDYDSEFRYAGRPVSSLQGLDGGQRVIYGGSFSKALYIALRLGYLVLPHELVERVVRHRAATEGFPAIGPQLQLTRFIEEGHFARHLRNLRTVHRHRLALFQKAAAHLGAYFEFDNTDAGLHVTAFRRPALAHIPDTQLAPLAHKAGIGAVPLSATYREATPRHGLLFGFANMPDGEIDNRLKNLASAIRQETGF
ncbi:PLP-dependent aminotransferase family protein [Kordiimonas marina]|uniref:MocR-like pyridoxine biosynthesis transcription factor PdxR n=1 Tax=Kordiimonas marina TaxID=2872312 RepID=UPI001FF6DB3D|nr:PLP-dependent aminotransferase family protein [Kordiimonas marina]MCJ9428295.1 PLP-dependent aminotransferase family protein [Kordiimonas marina]